jgi:hypothetical protein
VQEDACGGMQCLTDPNGTSIPDPFTWVQSGSWRGALGGSWRSVMGSSSRSLVRFNQDDGGEGGAARRTSAAASPMVGLTNWSNVEEFVKDMGVSELRL